MPTVRELWTIDAGNSNLKVALWGNRSAPIWQTRVARRDVDVDVLLAFRDVLELADVARPISCCLARRTDSETLAPVFRILSKGSDVWQVEHGVPLPIDYVYTEGAPGGDRLANAMALLSLSPGRPAMCVDLGTATHTEVLVPPGRFLGGVILPGMQLQAASLHAGTAGVLPPIDVTSALEPEPHPNSTQGAISHGIILGHLGALHRIVGATRQRHPDLQVFFTGGHGAVMQMMLAEGVLVPEMTLLGLRAYARWKQDGETI